MKKTRKTTTPQLPERTNCPWETREITRLVGMIRNNGLSIAKVAAVLHRSTDSCRSKLNKLLSGAHVCPNSTAKHWLDDIRRVRAERTVNQEAKAKPEAQPTNQTTGNASESNKLLDALKKAEALMEHHATQNGLFSDCTKRLEHALSVVSDNLAQSANAIAMKINSTVSASQGLVTIKNQVRSMLDRVDDTNVIWSYAMAKQVAAGKVTEEEIVDYPMTSDGIERILTMANQIRAKQEAQPQIKP